MNWAAAVVSGLEFAKELLLRLWPMREAKEKPEPQEQQSANPHDVAIAVSSYHAAKRSLEAATKK